MVIRHTIVVVFNTKVYLQYFTVSPTLAVDEDLCYFLGSCKTLSNHFFKTPDNFVTEDHSSKTMGVQISHATWGY